MQLLDDTLAAVRAVDTAAMREMAAFGAAGVTDQRATGRQGRGR